ncbi:hypothetical protein Pst134EB_012506 [Puccinia striiformis f. sp. tritici]|nr:hypothetical protein Pst134EB_012506 [Puccinia striiformis f. sp. tritici]
MSESTESILAKVKRTQEIYLAVKAFERISRKYVLAPEDDTETPGNGDPDLTIDDMSEKSKIWEKLETKLLPLIKRQIASLAISLDLHDVEAHPNPNLELSLGILSGLDRNLESAVSLTESFALGSPVPDQKYDHHLKKLKSYRCCQLRRCVQAVIHYTIRRLLECCQEMLQWCNLGIALIDDSSAREEASKSREEILSTISYAGDRIDDTIQWSRKSDWAIIHEDWMEAAWSFTRALTDLTALTNPTIDATPDLANLTINPTEEPDQIARADTRTRSDTVRKRLIEIIMSIISLAKLARILAKTASKMIPKKTDVRDGRRDQFGDD